MKLGEIYGWETDKATGHAARYKMHVYICEADGIEDNTFLFISSNDWWDDYPLTKIDYSFLDYDSYISCSGIVTYSDDELNAYGPQLLGQMKAEHLKELYRAIANSETMTGRHINRVCNALKVVL